jgi:hypothetical protein
LSQEFLGIVNANLLEAMHTILAMMDPLRISLKKNSSGKVNKNKKVDKIRLGGKVNKNKKIDKLRLGIDLPINIARRDSKEPSKFY